MDSEVNTVEYKDKLYGFCCNDCDKKFRKNPEKFVKNLSEDGTKFLK
ncbi:MAG: YHS domain-containing protein [Ignavibacteriaceae bacterium]|nr:YHS domain-containing protein [Ignavibacteriaceae bacterium]